MAVSHNGWPAIPSGTHESLAIIPHVQGRVLKGDVETIFRYIVDFINTQVEIVQYSQSWGYAYRKISGSESLTNHASGTAIDINAVKHPMGRRDTYSTENQAKIRGMVKKLDGVVRWGGDYNTRPDDMHFEINVPPSQAYKVKAVADKIRSGSLGNYAAQKETAPTPSVVNKTVNQMAQEVIAGIHGTGHEARKASLGISDALYEEVRAEINRLLGVKTSTPPPPPAPTKTIAEMADEVIAGKHGSGHEARQKSLGISSALYEEVRAEVNHRTSKAGGSSSTKTSSDGTDRHIPSSYPYTKTLTLQRLQKAAKTEVLTGEDYNHRLQALTSLKALGHISRRVPNTGESWVSLFKEAWKNWQRHLGYSGSDADGVPGALSVYNLTTRVGLNYWDNVKKVNKVTGSTPSEDTTDRHIPTTYPYTNTLTLQRLQKAAKTEVLTGEDYNHRLQALTSLNALKHIDRRVPRAGEKWVPLFKEAWKNWQKSLGYTGSDADGVPGATSVQKLAKRVGLKYWDSAKKTSSASTSPGLPRTGSSGKVNPTDGGYITTPFGKRPKNNTYWRAFGRHTGADYARSKCKSASLYAVSSGTVYYRWDKVLGHIAILEADDLKGKSHRYFWYCHLSSKPTTGRVKKGQRIGYIGQSGTGAAGPHLHIELLRTRTKWGSTWSDFRDPAPYLGQY